MTERRVRAAQVAAVLTEAKAVIQNPSNWIKGSFCRGPHPEERGDSPADYAQATAFCALGAIRKINNGCSHKHAEVALGHVRLPGADENDAVYGVWNFNDDSKTTHADVMALFDLAIEEHCKIVREEAAKDDPNLPDQG